jgi:hypothetical protein
LDKWDKLNKLDKLDKSNKLDKWDNLDKLYPLRSASLQRDFEAGSEAAAVTEQLQDPEFLYEKVTESKKLGVLFSEEESTYCHFKKVKH